MKSAVSQIKYCSTAERVQ